MFDRGKFPGNRPEQSTKQLARYFYIERISDQLAIFLQSDRGAQHIDIEIEIFLIDRDLPDLGCVAAGKNHEQVRARLRETGISLAVIQQFLKIAQPNRPVRDHPILRESRQFSLSAQLLAFQTRNLIGKLSDEHIALRAGLTALQTQQPNALLLDLAREIR